MLAPGASSWLDPVEAVEVFRDMHLLYLCYLGVEEPLTRTQVVSYLEGLAAQDSRRSPGRPVECGTESEEPRVLLLTFEPRPLRREEQRAWRHELAARGIEWHWVRYHKRPRAPATAWDVLVGAVVAWSLMRRRRGVRPRVWVLHARGHMAGLMAWIARRWTGASFVLDIRGFLAEEYADAGILRPNGLLYRSIKGLERRLVAAADALVVLTRRARSTLETWYPRETRGKPIAVIPCCVDLRLRADVGAGPDPAPTAPLALAYAGKLGGWYLTEEMIKFVTVARETVPGLRWQVWTQSPPRLLEHHLARYGLAQAVSVGQVDPEELPERLREAHAGLVFLGKPRAAFGVSPTKVAEYLYAGLPVVVNAGIGDTDELILGPDVPPARGGGDATGSPRVRKGRVGVVLYDLSAPAYREAIRALLELLAEPGIRDRCRKVAVRELGLQTVGWPRYRRLYRSIGRLAARPAAEPQPGGDRSDDRTVSPARP
jgi:glycosyltransferase involved in cell wall biosynthesis